MADTSNPVSTPPGGDDLIAVTEELGASAARMGALIVSMPLFLLPARERDESVAAATRLFTAVGDFHLQVVRTTFRGLRATTRRIAEAVDARQSGYAASASAPIATDTPSARR